MANGEVLRKLEAQALENASDRERLSRMGARGQQLALFFHRIALERVNPERANTGYAAPVYVSLAVRILGELDVQNELMRILTQENLQ